MELILCLRKLRNSLHFMENDGVYKSQPLALFGAKLYQFITPPPPNHISLRAILILFSHLCLGLRSILLPSGSHSNPVCTSHLSIRAVFPAHLILFVFNTRIIFGGDYGINLLFSVTGAKAM